jgi:hypothetical protein
VGDLRASHVHPKRQRPVPQLKEGHNGDSPRLHDRRDPRERAAPHFALAADLFGTQAQERLDLPNGYAVRFEPDAIEALARFVAKERRCCPFLSFTVDVEPNDGPVWLEIVGPEGTREFLAADLPGIQSS